MAVLPDGGLFSSYFLLDPVLRAAPVSVCQIAARDGMPGIVLFLCFFLVGLVQANNSPDAVHAEKLELLRGRISELKSELVSMRGKRDAMQDALEKSEKEIGVVTATLRGLDRQATQAQKGIEELQLNSATEQASLEKTRSILEKEIQIAYKTGKQERIKLLLNQEEPAALGRLMVYHEYFTRARTQAMQNIRDTLERLSGIERELILQRDELQDLIERKQNKSTQLLAQQNERRELLLQLEGRLSSKADQLIVLEEDERRLQALIQSLQQAIRDIPPTGGEYASLPSLKGKLRWPVAGHITMNYGEQHASGKLRSRGVHIASRAGADVRVIARGRVIFADWLRGFGLLMIIDHGDNYMSLYGQNSSLYKEVGEWVGRDEVIAAAGNSGGQVQAGLYLELRKDGRPVNPGGWIKGKPKALEVAGQQSR